eukprot:78365_1
MIIRFNHINLIPNYQQTKKGNPLTKSKGKEPSKYNPKPTGLKNIIIPPVFNVPRSQIKPYFDDWESTQKAISTNTITPADDKLLQLILIDADNSPINYINYSLHKNINQNKQLIKCLINTPVKTYNNNINASRTKSGNT